MKPKVDSVANFIALLEILQDWISAKRLSVFAGDRRLRMLANASGGRIITGQRGYKAARYATRKEIAHAANWLEHQGEEMLRRARGIRGAVEKPRNSKKSRFIFKAP